jgi:hypothetical protein
MASAVVGSSAYLPQLWTWEKGAFPRHSEVAEAVIYFQSHEIG